MNKALAILHASSAFARAFLRATLAEIRHMREVGRAARRIAAANGHAERNNK